MAGDVPLAALPVLSQARVLGVHRHVFVGDLARRHTEGHVVVEVDLGLLLVGAAAVVRPHAGFERPHAGLRHDLVMVAFRDVGFGDQIAVGVVPARLRRILPAEQAHVPCQFEHRARREVDLAVRMDAELGFCTGCDRIPMGPVRRSRR